jgi:spore coat protein CotH
MNRNMCLSRMKHVLAFWGTALLAATILIPLARAKDGEVNIALSNSAVMLKVDGDKDDDWWIQTSANLTTWTTLTNFGTLLSGNETNAPWRSAGLRTNAALHYRARQTYGLYDTTMLRTISLTFTQANWSNLMVQARAAGTNVYCSLLTMANGATNVGVGARFRGNTSFTGMGPEGAPAKKSISLTIDYSITNADLMGYSSINLNNAYGDETIMRESVYFNIMRNYTVCPACCLAQLYINGGNRGVYSQNQQQNGDLIREYFPSNDGDRFRAGNMDASAAFVYLGNTNVSTYTPHYELKSDYNTNAWPRFINAIYVFNTLATNTIRDTAEDVIAVDRWLWFLACENVFADDDSYWNKGSDYMLYYEPESGRVHPVEHDGNEAFMAGDASLSPTQGSSGTTRPVLNRLLGNAELRQRYFAHMRTVLAEWFNPTNAIALVNQFVSVSSNAIYADPLKGYTGMTTYTTDLTALKTFITNRYTYLKAHAELTPLPPNIVAVYAPTSNLAAGQIPFVTAKVLANGANGINSVWLYHRGKSYGKFSYRQMLDDGAHGDGAAGDGVYGAATTNYPGGSKVRYYVEARSANAAKAAAFSPPRAEQETYSYKVTLTTATNTSVVINEFMADNAATVADPQGEYDDWIELRNLTEQPISVAGLYLSDEATDPHKWQIPAGTTIAANGYLLVWADENGSDTPGLHANFKLSMSGEAIYLSNTNAVLDSITFGTQETDVSYGRSSANDDVWTFMSPTPGAANN